MHLKTQAAPYYGNMPRILRIDTPYADTGLPVYVRPDLRAMKWESGIKPPEAIEALKRCRRHNIEHRFWYEQLSLLYC